MAEREHPAKEAESRSLAPAVLVASAADRAAALAGVSDQRGSKVERADGQQSASDHCVWSLIVGAVLFHFLVRPSATSTYPIDETAGAASATRADGLSPSRPIQSRSSPRSSRYSAATSSPPVACEPDAFVTSSAAGGLRSRSSPRRGRVPRPARASPALRVRPASSSSRGTAEQTLTGEPFTSPIPSSFDHDATIRVRCCGTLLAEGQPATARPPARPLPFVGRDSAP